MKSKVKILFVEDDPNLGFVIQDRLKMLGFTVHLARDGKSGLQQFNGNNYDLCILDVMLPQKDGFSLAEDIRKTDMETPIIFLTARNQIADKAQGFTVGADDYLTKPFEHDELVMRIHALLKRTNKEKKTPSIEEYDLASFKFTPETRTLERKGEQKRLTKTESEVLHILCRNRDKIMERDMILNMVWGKDDYHTGRSLDVYISKLRKYLSQDETLSIENVHGVGFILKTDEERD